METKEMYGYYVQSETEQEEILNEKKKGFSTSELSKIFLCPSFAF